MLSLSTPLVSTDSVHILFPSSFNLNSVTASQIAIAGFSNFPLTKLGNQLILTANLNSPVLNAILQFSISGIGIPFSCASTTIQFSLLTYDNYYRINQTMPYSPSPGALTLSVNCLNQ